MCNRHNINSTKNYPDNSTAFVPLRSSIERYFAAWKGLLVGLGDENGKLRFKTPEMACDYINALACIWNYKIDHGEDIDGIERKVKYHEELGELASGDAPPTDDQNLLPRGNNEYVLREWQSRGYFGGEEA